MASIGEYGEPDEQRRIAAVLNDCVREIDVLERLQQHAETHERALLARLVAVDVPVPA
jgi:hypothetical protein